MTDNPKQKMPPTKARAGIKLGEMRYVLIISLLAVVIALFVAYIVI